MKLKDLEKAGGFVPVDGVKKSVTWKNRHTGEEFVFDVFVKRMSFGTMERFLVSTNDDDRSRGAMTIAECILFGDAGEPMTYEQAYQLEPSLASVLMNAVTEVNTPSKEAIAKN